jgi:glycosyltransferase involved in cell wall biosynthesis
VLRESFVQEGDEVIFHVHDPYLLTIAMGLRKRFPGSQVVFDRHDHFETWKNRLGLSVPGIFERWHGKKIAELIIANPGVENLPKAYSGKTVTQISNYPLEKYFDREAIDKKIDKLGSDGEISLAYFGALSLDFDRDIELMLRLMASVMRENPNVRSIVAGRIFEPAVNGRLDDMSKEFGERFSYLGELPYAQVIERSQKAHVGFFLLNPDKPMWSPSRPYSANKIYEYLQTGTIPVVRAIIEEPEGVRDCALFFDERSTYEEILSALKELCRDREKMGTLMSTCFETGLNYTWEKVAPRYLECYERIFTAGEKKAHR